MKERKERIGECLKMNEKLVRIEKKELNSLFTDINKEAESPYIIKNCNFEDVFNIDLEAVTYTFHYTEFVLKPKERVKLEISYNLMTDIFNYLIYA